MCQRVVSNLARQLARQLPTLHQPPRAPCREQMALQRRNLLLCLQHSRLPLDLDPSQTNSVCEIS